MIVSLVAAAFVGLIGLAAPAPAATDTAIDVTYVNASSVNDSASTKSVRASCPFNRILIGTGFNITGAESSVVLDQLVPSTGSVLAGASEGQGGTAASWQLTATAVCATQRGFLSAGAQIVSVTSPFEVTPFPFEKDTQVPCPAGTKAFGNGASVNNGQGQVAIASLAGGLGEAGNIVATVGHPDADGYTNPWSITVYAICGNPSIPGLSYPTGFNVDSVFDTTSPKTPTVSCAAGQKVLSFGWGNGSGGGSVITKANQLSSDATSRVAAVSAFMPAGGSTGNWARQSYPTCATAYQNLGAADLNDACHTQFPGRGLNPRLSNIHEALSWTCFKESDGTSLGINVDTECAKQFGAGTLSGLSSRLDPFSWFCMR